MPNYSVPQAGSQQVPNQGLNLTDIQPGDWFFCFNAESPTAPQASVAFATGYCPGGGPRAGLVFTISWASAPTAQLKIQGSNVDADAQYQDLTTITNIQFSTYADAGGFAFYRAKLVSQSAGGAVTVLVQR